jgi:hypothetical protein
VVWWDRWHARRTEPQIPPGMFSIAQVSRASGLPQPVIMQWVSRTWVDGVGWVFTVDQFREAVDRAAQWRASRTASQSSPQEDPPEVVVCDGCGGVAVVDAADPQLWLQVVQLHCSVHAHPEGRDYCPDCVVVCPFCAPDTDELCQECFGAGRVPHPGGPRPA